MMSRTKGAVGLVMLSSLAGDVSTRNEVLLWDGRLDNRGDFAHLLPPASQPPASDSGAVLAVYDRWGMRGLGRVIGDWSTVIHDRRRRLLVLASDYAGVRPLYYVAQRGSVRWSTDLAALADTARITDIDEAYVRSFLERGSGGCRTPFTGIYAVPAGHAVSVSADGVTIERFWAPPVSSRIRYEDPHEYDEQLRVLFAEAVTVRLRTESVVTAELSGGLDSSSIVCMADRLIRSEAVPAPSLATVSYVHRDSADVPFIRAVEAFRGAPGVHLSTEDHPLVTGTDAGGSMPSGWGPLQKAAVQMTRSLGAKVLLTGQNGDLIMGNCIDDSLQVAAAIRRGAMAAACRQALSWSKVTRVPMLHVLSHSLLAALPPRLTPSTIYRVEPNSRVSCVTPSVRKRTADAAGCNPFADEWRHAPPERRSHFRALALMREIRALQRPEFAQDIDYTHPFGHRPLVEFLMSIPADVVCRPGEPRRLMRRALAHLWPPSLQGRRSKGLFNVPWIRSLQPLATSMLASSRWLVVEHGWVDRGRALDKLRRLLQGIDCDDPELRHLILLEYWLRNRLPGYQDQPRAA
jgi:asparagine synthase (glutamine-hydrolysing)